MNLLPAAWDRRGWRAHAERPKSWLSPGTRGTDGRERGEGDGWHGKCCFRERRRQFALVPSGRRIWRLVSVTVVTEPHQPGGCLIAFTGIFWFLSRCSNHGAVGIGYRKRTRVRVACGGAKRTHGVGFIRSMATLAGWFSVVKSSLSTLRRTATPTFAIGVSFAVAVDHGPP